MEWRRWGLKDNPYSLREIDEMTLDLFAGRSNEIKCLQNVFFVANRRVVFLEGEPGIGKTSIGNFWRYSSMQKRLCFTPYPEIRIEPRSDFYAFAMKAIEVLNWSLSQSHPFISRDAEFKTHENKSKELFNQFAGSPSSNVTFTDGESRYLYDEVKALFQNIHRMISKFNYEFGTVIQISFTGLNESYLSEKTDDFKQKLWGLYLIEGFRWILIGKPSLQEWLFHSESKVLSTDLCKILVSPLDLPQLHELLQRRRDYLALSQNAQLPVAPEVIDYLYRLSGGHLKRILSICEKLTELSGSYHELDLKSAKSILTRYFQDEIRQRWQLTQAALDVLKFLINEEGASPGFVADRMKKLRPNISKILMHLKEANLVRSEVKGRNRIYYPMMEAKIAFL